MKTGSYFQNELRGFYVFFLDNRKCPTESIQLNEAIFEPIQGKAGLSHTASLHFFVFYDVCPIFLNYFFLCFPFCLLSYDLSPGPVIFWGPQHCTQYRVLDIIIKRTHLLKEMHVDFDNLMKSNIL